MAKAKKERVARAFLQTPSLFPALWRPPVDEGLRLPRALSRAVDWSVTSDRAGAVHNTANINNDAGISLSSAGALLPLEVAGS